MNIKHSKILLTLVLGISCANASIEALSYGESASLVGDVSSDTSFSKLNVARLRNILTERKGLSDLMKSHYQGFEKMPIFSTTNSEVFQAFVGVIESSLKFEFAAANHIYGTYETFLSGAALNLATAWSSVVVGLLSKQITEDPHKSYGRNNPIIKIIDSNWEKIVEDYFSGGLPH